MSQFFFQKILYVIPSTLCHSFHITVILSGLLSYLPYHCHSFQIIVIPYELLSFFPNIVIPSKLFRELQILTSSKSFPYPKGEKNGHRRWPYMRVVVKKNSFVCFCEEFTSWKFPFEIIWPLAIGLWRKMLHICEGP